jgi:hypothetical protein
MLVIGVVVGSVLLLLLLNGVGSVLAWLLIVTTVVVGPWLVLIVAIVVSLTSFGWIAASLGRMIHVEVVIMASLLIEAIWAKEEAIRIIK